MYGVLRIYVYCECIMFPFSYYCCVHAAVASFIACQKKGGASAARPSRTGYDGPCLLAVKSFTFKCRRSRKAGLSTPAAKAVRRRRRRRRRRGRVPTVPQDSHTCGAFSCYCFAYQSSCTGVCTRTAVPVSRLCMLYLVIQSIDECIQAFWVWQSAPPPCGIYGCYLGTSYQPGAHIYKRKIQNRSYCCYVLRSPRWSSKPY